LPTKTWLENFPDRFEHWARPANIADQVELTSQPELRNRAGGNLLAKAENGTPKTRLFEEKGTVPVPVYKMDKDDQEHWETCRLESPTRYKESESCNFSHQPSVHNFRQWWLSVKKEVAKASGIPDKGYAWISKVEDIEDPEHLQVSEGKNCLTQKLQQASRKSCMATLPNRFSY
jgi:hypothetical protein